MEASVVERATVQALLATIEKRLERLSDLAEPDVAEFAADQDAQDIAERNFEVMIQACIDLAFHILADRAEPMPETNRAAFAALAGTGLIDTALGDRLQQMAGFRNLLAHGYVRLVPERVHAAFDSLGDVRELIASLLPYLKQQGALS